MQHFCLPSRQGSKSLLNINATSLTFTTFKIGSHENHQKGFTDVLQNILPQLIQGNPVPQMPRRAMITKKCSGPFDVWQSDLCMPNFNMKYEYFLSSLPLKYYKTYCKVGYPHSSLSTKHSSMWGRGTPSHSLSQSLKMGKII